MKKKNKQNTAKIILILLGIFFGYIILDVLGLLSPFLVFVIIMAALILRRNNVADSLRDAKAERDEVKKKKIYENARIYEQMRREQAKEQQRIKREQREAQNAKRRAEEEEKQRLKKEAQKRAFEQELLEKYGSLELGRDVVSAIESSDELKKLMKTSILRIEDLDVRATMEETIKIIDSIVAHVQSNPEDAKKLGDAMRDYYPTVKKLIDSYIEIQKSPKRAGGGEGKAECEAQMKELAKALENLNSKLFESLDEEYQQVAIDIAADISVLQSMVQQDGLI